MTCLFHSRQYASNIQRIFNLLRKNKIQVKCDLNYIGKRALCICALSADQKQISDEDFQEKEKQYQKLKKYQWLEEIDQIIEYKIIKKCDCQISIYKLLQFICDLSEETKFLQLINTIRKDYKIKSVRYNHPSFLRRRIQLKTLPNQISSLIGQNGHIHKQIMEDTKTKIHFENLPFNLPSKSSKKADFNLEAFQSTSPIQAIITGDTLESIGNAIKALQKLEHRSPV